MHDLIQLEQWSNEGCVFSMSSGASGGRRNKKGRGSLHRDALQCRDCLQCSLNRRWIMTIVKMLFFFFYFFGTYGRTCWTEEPYDAESLCINLTSCSCRHMSADVCTCLLHTGRFHWATKMESLSWHERVGPQAIYIVCEWEKKGLNCLNH